MPHAHLTRRITFAAAHRYSLPQWSDEKNAEVFGACSNPHYHGHSYTCDVTVTAPIDEVTGMLVDLAVLDRVLAEEVHRRFDHRNINLEVAEFGEGKLVPTGENLARFIFERVQSALGSEITVTSVVVAEDQTLRAEYRR